MAIARKIAGTPTAPTRKATATETTAVRAGPARKAPVQPVAAATIVVTAAPANAVKPEKPRKPKLVRDSFTIPKAEYVVLEALKQRAANAGVPVKKSELLRAGIKTLAGLGDGALLAALGAVPTIKTGRPAKA